MIETFDLGARLAVRHARFPCRCHKQRLALALFAVDAPPPVLFLDEPTSWRGPDHPAGTHITGLVRKGVTIMVTTAPWTRPNTATAWPRLCATDRAGYARRAQRSARSAPNNPTPTMEDAFIHL